MAPNGPADLVPRNLRALHGALEHSVTVQATRLPALLDDLVVRGSLSRADADQLLGQLVSASRTYSHALLQVLDAVTESASGPVTATAGQIAQTISQTVSQTVSQSVGQTVSHALAQVPRRRRPSPAAHGSLPDLSALTVAQARSRLTGLDAPALRRLRAQEESARNRKGVLAAIDRRLV